MSRSAYRCRRCAAVLATVRSAATVVIDRDCPNWARASFDHRKGETRIRCACGHLNVYRTERSEVVVEASCIMAPV